MKHFKQLGDMLKEKKAAMACTSCTKKKAKRSGFSPSCINPGECVFQSNPKQLNHSTSAAGSIAMAQSPESVQATALHCFGP